MKKSIFLSLGTIVLCLTLIIGVSFAAFTSSGGFSGNTVTTSKVDITPSLYEGESNVKKLSVDNLNPGETKEYTLKIDNDSTTQIAYRTIFLIDGYKTLVDAITISVGGDEIDFNASRGTSSWVREITGDVSTEIAITLDESISKDVYGEVVTFDFTVEAIYDNFVGVSNQDDLNVLVEDEFAVLTTDLTELTISKNVYLDLNGFKIDKLNVIGDDITFVELTNGVVGELDVDAINATIYSNIDVLTKIDLNVSGNSFYLKSDVVNTNLVVNIKNGKVVLDVLTPVEVNVVESTEESSVVLVTSEKTVVTKLEVEENANQKIEVENNGEIAEVVLNSDNQDIVMSNVELKENTNFSYVTVDGEGFYYSTVDGVSYKNEAITFEDFLNVPSGVFYFAEGTYELTQTLLLEKDVEIHGLGDVVFKKASSTAYSNNTLVESYAKLVLDNVSFYDHIDSNIASTCITSYGVLSVQYCTFEDFAKNSIAVKDGEADIFSNSFYYLTKTGSAGNGIVVQGGAVATITYNTFDSFEQGSDVWAATSVLVYDGGYAAIYNNSFNNCKYAIVLTYMYSDEVGSFVEDKNTFNAVTYNVSIQDDGAYIVTEEATSSSYAYMDEETGYRYVFFGAKYSNIQSAINAAEEGAYIYVKEGTYNVESTYNSEATNLYIDKSINLIAVGEVNLVTTLTGNSNVVSQSTVYINASDVLFDGFTVNITTLNPNKALEIAGGNNITIQNCVIDGGCIYIGGSLVGDYYIQNNSIINSADGIILTNGAGNFGEGLSVITNNDISGALLLTGTRPNGWNLYELEKLPLIEKNSFGYYSEVIDGVEYNYYIRLVSMQLDLIESISLPADIASKNTLVGLTTASYTILTETSGSGNTYYGFYGTTSTPE